ncbi:MAG TPA: SAM-dependent chlorinase/fluorinase [Ktedonobacterales bacterium]|nr:SAM-dependent chlorinase/fluorinase [Ktedonobacterales bacterium]
MTPAPVALLTDFGTADGYPGVMRGVILGIAPGVPLVDLTHDIPPQDIATGAWVLGTAWPYFPDRTIFLCVVDPGVGSQRRAVAVRADERYFVGPDNGLLSYVLADTSVQAAVTLDRSAFHLPHPSATFHGRDIFAPVAAHLAAGVALGELGSAIAPESLVRLAMPAPQTVGGQWVGHVVHVDRFGNLITDFAGALGDALLAAPGVVLCIADARIVERAATFAAGAEGAPVIVRDSSGHLAVAVRNGSAASLLGVSRGDLVRVEGFSGVSGVA